MFWVHCGLFVLVIAVPGFINSADSTSKREADYTLDDSFWNEETPAGEVERLLREYRQNQELVRDIGAHNYQIIYPVQLRHHEKMGISTREAGSPKYPQRGGYGDGYQSARGRSRAGKHFHRTSLLIKAFNHKFRLDLELNTQLLAPNLMQKDFLGNGVEQMTKQEIEHCYYHGTVKDYPGASAAFHTCNGVSGVIHLGNETFVIQPFYGGDLSRHPHVIFEARTKVNKGCGNAGGLERRLAKNRRQKHVLGLSKTVSDRYKRDVREATKYIETAMIIDKAMFDKRNGSTRSEVVHDAIQVANIADLYFRGLNTRVSVVYIETWQGGNKAAIDSTMEIGRALQNFNDYLLRNMYLVTSDTTQLLTGETFIGGESGIAVPETVCSTKSAGISVDLNTYEPHLLAGTMAHMIGHNIGMGHDDGRENCFCRDWHGCIMAQSIVGAENVQPYKFSECSKSDYEEALKAGRGICLFNKPNELESRSCGNRVIDDGEQCDCGTIDECSKYDPCCDPITCKLTSGAQCARGPCCTNDCKLRQIGYVCRESTNECDLPEVCTGESGQCPTDVYKKNGKPCANNRSFCFAGYCPDLNVQCEAVWGDDVSAADMQCFEQFNSKGSINGHCGTDAEGHFIKCEAENVRCGSLQCQKGSKQPVIDGMHGSWTRTIISTKGTEYECKATSKVEGIDVPGMGLVRDGTSCGEHSICVNQTCTSSFPHIDSGKCPSNNDNIECSGNGVCTNLNKCYCNIGWSGTDCSIQMDIPTLEPLTTTTGAPSKAADAAGTKLQKKETPYEEVNTNLSTLAMVLILLCVVKGVFICFALVARCCYRRKSTIQKYDPPYSKKPAPKAYSERSSNHHPEVVALDNVNKILTFGSMPTYSCDQRVLFQQQPNVTADGSRLKEHKTPMKRMGGMYDEDGGTGAEDVVSVIDLPPNSLTKLPEKGILKKHGGYGLPDSAMVAQTLSSLNGYHGELMEALRNATTHRGMSGTPSGSGNLMDDEMIRKSLAECGYPDGYRKATADSGQDNIDNQDDDDEEDVPPTCGPIRIRTLEDIIRQLEVHSARHMSPNGSEDMRISENEGDRHYRIDSSVCSESSQGSRRCSRGREDDRFVYGRYRQPSSRSPYGTHQHSHQHSHQMHEEEGIYETADPDRGSNTRGETPDSESDAFIQAQQQLARWTSEDRLQHRAPQQPPPSPPPSTAVHLRQVHLHQPQQLLGSQPTSKDQLPIRDRGYYPPPSSLAPKDLNGLQDVDGQGKNSRVIINGEAINAQSHQQIMINNNKSKLLVKKCPDVCTGVDVNQLPNINNTNTDTDTIKKNINKNKKSKCPLDDNDDDGDDDDDDDGRIDCNIINNDDNIPNELITNTSDNENTALLPPTHFPEYKH
ncbi:disintegrin and metalloproteinase domain-containing protein 9 isoform X13 [Cotesia glomerata]|uniref:disintegrin and metalloproteinase domain-containing protein 9 isoform X13 n=1 Tax=Cotesia glomerata TaxID=32391 RepID=UPI001D030844|nr:disintegrin and metalloproteinase domain-containing protein 9 isoform X13 [Cotesia glomerata]